MIRAASAAARFDDFVLAHSPYVMLIVGTSNPLFHKPQVPFGVDVLLLKMSSRGDNAGLLVCVHTDVHLPARCAYAFYYSCKHIS